MTPELWLAAARERSDQGLTAELIECVQSDSLEGGTFSYDVSDLIRGTLRAEDREIVRELLTLEIIEHENANDNYASETLRLCGCILFQIGNVEDSLLVWRAKSVTFDADILISIELIAGAGVEKTVRYLKETNTEESNAAFNCFVEDAEVEHFDDFQRLIQLWFDDE